MKATDDLRAEHRGIERMLAITEKAAQRLEAGKDVPSQVFVNAADFFRNFADKCHHGKEENELFPALEKAGIPRQGGPIGVMLSEHEQGRAYLKAMASAAERFAGQDASARKQLIDAARGYAGVLRAHIYKEDNILFPMADSAIPSAEAARLAVAFDKIESDVMGPGVHERYHAMLDDMEKQASSW
jgi:hemerythrin-like domain-containing protein